MSDPSPIQSHYASETRIERLAEVWVRMNGFARARDYVWCQDERNEWIEDAVKHDHSLRTDAERDFFRACLRELLPPAVEVVEAGFRRVG